MVTYEDWEKAVMQEIKADSLWKMEAYRLALFVADLGWHDVTKLSRDHRAVALSDQLYRSLGSISANLAEGYSRGTGKDCARFYEYALGSARESRDWYYKSRYILGEPVTRHRVQLLTKIIRLLLTMVPQQRHSILRDEMVLYELNSDDFQFPNDLLQNVPLP